MILERGNMWDVFGNTDWFLITTNPIVNKQGAAVMGRGIALEAAKRFPQMPYDFAKKIKDRANHTGETPTWRNVFTIGVYNNQRVGCFMVKHHWNEHANEDVIRDSVDGLLDILETLNELGKAPIRIDLNFPGIGNGHLPRVTVLPIIQRLPDCVHVWEYEL